ncbi:MAG: hypothetical protein ACT4OL_09440, partial [Nitrospiraceae bacterium]
MTRVNLRHGVIVASVLVWAGMVGNPTTITGVSPVSQEIQNLYDQHEYQKTLEELAKLDKEASGAPDVRRLRIRSLLRLGNPKDAIEEYDRLEGTRKQEDQQVLREVALG